MIFWIKSLPINFHNSANTPSSPSFWMFIIIEWFYGFQYFFLDREVKSTFCGSTSWNSSFNRVSESQRFLKYFKYVPVFHNHLHYLVLKCHLLSWSIDLKVSLNCLVSFCLKFSSTYLNVICRSITGVHKNTVKYQ